MSVPPYPVEDKLTGIVLAHKTAGMIADAVCPRSIQGVESETFKYYEVDIHEDMTPEDTLVGRLGEPNKVEFKATEQTATTQDHALDHMIPRKDRELAAPFSSLSRASMKLAGRLDVGREKRVADMTFNAANYAAGRKTTLSGTSQWSDKTNSTPIDDIQGGIDSMVIMPNVGVIGGLAFSQLRAHPDIVKAIHANSGDSGLVSRQAIASLFGLDELLVGAAYINNNNRGQTGTATRLWGKHMALLHVAQLADNEEQEYCFSQTFQRGERFATDWHEPKYGIKGADQVRVGESLVEVIISNQAGYFLEDVAA